MSATTPLRLLVPILCFSLAAGPSLAQVPKASAMRPSNGDTAWQEISKATTDRLANAIEVIEERVVQSRDEAAWHKMDCHNTKLAELRGLRRAAQDATASIHRALADGHSALVSQNWDRLLITAAHTPLLFQEALGCNDVRREDLEQISVVRVSSPSWDEDEDLGVTPVTHGR